MLPEEKFVDELVEEFNTSGFYSQPKETKLYLIINGTQELIGNAVVANIEEANEKIPVYSFNSSQYAKFLQGKEIITGVLALRKITVSNFLSLIKSNITQVKNDGTLEMYTEQFIELDKIATNDQVEYMMSGLKEKIDLYQKNVDSLFDYNDGEFGNKNNLIYYIEKLQLSNSDAKLKIVYEGKMGPDASPTVNIKDVLFIKKQTEINVDKSDIIEVYSFIGNPDY